MAYEVWDSCMLVPGFSRSECASWVQAWGSVLAIAAGFAIAKWSYGREQYHAKSVAVKRIRTIAAIVEQIAEEVVRLGNARNVDAIRLRRAVLQEALTDARSISVEPLNLQWIAAASAIRSVAAQLLEVLLGLEQSPPALSPHAAAGFAEHYLEALKPHMAVVRADHPGVAEYEEE